VVIRCLSDVGFLLLGPVEVWAGAERVAVGLPRMELLLAALAVDVDRVVPVDVLTDRIWGEDPPPNARRTLHSYLARLRRVVERVPAECGEPSRVLHRAGGYQLATDPAAVDVHRAGRLVAAAYAEADAARRLPTLRSAAALWRGEPLGGLGGEWAERTRQRLRQRQVEVTLMWAAAEVEAGTPAAVLPVLDELAAAHPLVEAVAGAQIRALSAAGRTAEALACYATVHRRLADELGTSPGPELRAAHQAVLRNEPPAGSRAGSERGPALDLVPVPRQLPADVPAFAGRAEQLARLDRMLTPEQVATVVTVSGTAGVGKTALAVRWAHRVAARFGAGQLYVNLRGFDPAGEAVAPGSALGAFLDALGVAPERVPADLDARAALYRSMLAGRRMLVVLDNARDAEQVRPLLPGSASTVTVVTSRDQLTALVAAGARPVPLTSLSTVDAHALLSGRLGAARLAAEPAAAGAVVAACGGLPLALGIAAARAVLTGFDLSAVAAELADERGRLAVLAAGDPTTRVRAVLSWSYRALPAGAARLFRLLGAHPGPDVGTGAAAAVAGVDPAAARALLTELARASLVTEHRPGRWAMHDLLALYAADLLGTGADRDAATRRLLDHYVHTGHAAARLLTPDRDPAELPPPPAPGAAPAELAGQREAAAWLAAEHRAMLAAQRLAAAGGYDAQAWLLAWALDTYLRREGLWADADATWRAALPAARRLGHLPAEAYAHSRLAREATLARRFDAARAHLRSALACYAEAGDRLGQARVHHNLAGVAERQRAPARALEHAQQALIYNHAAGRRSGLASALNSIGWYHAELGHHARALATCRRALAIYEDAGDAYGQALACDSLGYAHARAGQHAAAAERYRRALRRYRDVRDRYGEAGTLDRLGDAQLALGDRPAARASWQRASVLLDELGHPDLVAVRAKLAAVAPAARAS
jgi:DNA-binding SARP family transcriptional activator/tetratricopeptide (TPR) repeat protein